MVHNSIDADPKDLLEELRKESTGFFVVSTGVVGFMWFFWVVFPGLGGEKPSAVAWIGSSLLLITAICGYIVKQRHTKLSSYVLIAGILGGVACILLITRALEVAYLFIIPVIIASVLTKPLVFLCTASLAGSTALALGRVLLGISLGSSGVLLFIAILLVVTLASWFSARNLRIALVWAWHGYERARKSQQNARDRQGELGRALKALDEATYRLERTNYMLGLARDQADEARRIKQQFAQTISHELRTPLNLIVGFTELMAESPEHYGIEATPVYLHDLGIVYRNARHLQSLVNDVLDLARIEAAQMTVLPEETEPVDLLQQAVDTMRGLVEGRGLTMKVDIAPELPLLWIDPVRIRQVLFNLLNNAVRFTESGIITVRGQRTGDEVCFSVEDTGLGIAPEDLSRIFVEFEQADGGTKRRHEGAGLGLAISKRFVDLHGGRMWVESTLGAGSTFSFALPILRDALTHSAQGKLSTLTTSERSEPGGHADPVLLVVTRSLSAASLLSRYVHHCRTVVVPNLDEARGRACDVVPQVIVVDRAAGGYGLDEVSTLAEEWGLPDALVISTPLPGEAPLQARMQVEGYLVKPVSRESVWELMRGLGQDVSEVLIVDDDRDFVKYLSRVLEDNPVRPYSVTGAYSGQQALLKLQQRVVDVVLLDLGLPDIDGYEVVRRMRSSAALRDVPVVIVSAHGETDEFEVLNGTIECAKSGGLRPGEVVRFVQHAISDAVAAAPSPEAPQAVLA